MYEPSPVGQARPTRSGGPHRGLAAAGDRGRHRRGRHRPGVGAGGPRHAGRVAGRHRRPPRALRDRRRGTPALRTHAARGGPGSCCAPGSCACAWLQDGAAAARHLWSGDRDFRRGRRHPGDHGPRIARRPCPGGGCPLDQRQDRVRSRRSGVDRGSPSAVARGRLPAPGGAGLGTRRSGDAAHLGRRRDHGAPGHRSRVSWCGWSQSACCW